MVIVFPYYGISQTIKQHFRHMAELRNHRFELFYSCMMTRWSMYVVHLKSYITYIISKIIIISPIYIYFFSEVYITPLREQMHPTGSSD